MLINRYRAVCLAFSSILLLTAIACNTLQQEPTEPILVTPVAFEPRVPTERPTLLPRLEERPTPTPTPWPPATPDTSIPLATTTMSPTATPVETPPPRATRIPTLRPAPTAEQSALTRETAIFRASHGLSLSQQNLEGADLSNNSWGAVNFSFANLRKVDFTGAILRYANFRHADLTGADLTGADLTGADFTGAETKGAIFRDLSNLNWIDRELVLTGELPRIPNWFFPPLAEERFIGNAEKGDRVAQRQEFWLLSRGEWCGLSPTERLMVMDYVGWLGNDTSDWLDEQKEIRRAWDRCPPGDSSYWETKRPNQ